MTNTILYKYTDSGGKDIILNSRLKVNDPDKFNDPFELALNIQEVSVSNVKKSLKNKNKLRSFFEKGVRSGKLHESWKEFRKRNSDPHYRDKIANELAPNLSYRLKENFNQQNGSVADYFLLCCFCGFSLCPMDEVLMWAHYSDGLRGLRFSFEKDLLAKRSTEISKVQYLERIVTADLNCFIGGDKDSFCKNLELSLSAKSKSWEYEQEYRWFVATQNVQRTAEGYFVPINLNAIKRIDFGAKCSPEVINEISEKVKNSGLKVDFKKAVLDTADFKLVYIDL